MSPTRLEKTITQRRRSQGIIRPLLEELFMGQVRIEDQDDIDFINHTATKMALREAERKDNLVFSPSGLASCLRRVYLGRHWKALGLERVELPNVEAHGIFSEGDFRHLQYHFYMHKLDKHLGHKFILVDIEVPVVSKRKDHGGTVDCIAFLPEHEITVVIDYKGWNVRNFQQALNGLPHSPRIQVTDYMMLLNAGVWKFPYELYEQLDSVGLHVPEKISDAFILAFNKGGPDNKHPLALHEHHVALSDNLPEVQIRLGVLREHEREKEIPSPECTSTKTAVFQNCPFAGYCLKEVREVERRKARRQDTKEFKVSRPARNYRARRD